MDNAHLIRMAHQIGQFFEAMPDREEAERAAVSHLRLFWAPPMRHALAQALHTPESAGLGGFMHAALQRHAGDWMPAPRG